MTIEPNEEGYKMVQGYPQSYFELLQLDQISFFQAWRVQMWAPVLRPKTSEPLASHRRWERRNERV